MIPNRLLVFLLLSASLCPAARAATDEELAHRINAAFETAWEVKDASFPGRIVKAERFGEMLSDLSDEEKLRGMLANLYQGDERRSAKGKPYSYLLPGSTCAMIAINPELITDPSPLKRMLAAENDPRKFFLQERLAMSLLRHHKTDFVPELSRMLFRDEICAVPEYDNMKLPTSVGWQTYQAIVDNLQKLGAGFQKPPRQPYIPERKRQRMLAAWLRENWPGCENLRPPEDKTAGAIPPASARVDQVPEPKAVPSDSGLSGPSARRNSRAVPVWAFAAVLAALAFAFLAWLKFKRTKSAPLQ